VIEGPGINLKLQETHTTHEAISNMVNHSRIKMMVGYSSLLEFKVSRTKDNNNLILLTNKTKIKIVVEFSSLHACKEMKVSQTRYNSHQECRTREHHPLRTKLSHLCSNYKSNFKEIVLIT